MEKADGIRSEAAPPLARERNIILAVLVLLAAAAWAILFWQARHGDDRHGPDDGHAALFLALWVAMMVAMMFPTAAPMILVFARVHASRRARAGQAFVPTWVFVRRYLLVWTLFGGLAYVLARAGQALAERVPCR